MNKFIKLASVASILILMGAGCGQSGSNVNDKSAANQNKQTEQKPVTSKSSQDLVNDFKGALARVFGGEVKLTANSTGDLGTLKKVTGLTFSISRNPTDADLGPLVNALTNLGYKKLDAETADDSYYGRNTNISFSGSPYYLSVNYYNNKKEVGMMLIETAQAEKLMNENQD